MVSHKQALKTTAKAPAVKLLNLVHKLFSREGLKKS